MRKLCRIRLGEVPTCTKTTADAVLRIEEKIDLTAYVPEGFGTGDDVILADGTMEIIDLKYGREYKCLR